MFLEDELELNRLRRADSFMGWLAILFVAALVFMFAGMMNSASASGSAARVSDGQTVRIMAQSRPADGRLFTVSAGPTAALFSIHGHLPTSRDLTIAAENHVTGSNDDTAASQAVRATAVDPIRTGSIAAAPGDRHIMMGLMMVAFALTGSSFLLLAFGGPRRPSEAEDDADVA